MGKTTKSTRGAAPKGKRQATAASTASATAAVTALQAAPQPVPASAPTLGPVVSTAAPGAPEAPDDGGVSELGGYIQRLHVCARTYGSDRPQSVTLDDITRAFVRFGLEPLDEIVLHNIVLVDHGAGMGGSAGATVAGAAVGSAAPRRRITRAVHASLMAVAAMYQQSYGVSVAAQMHDMYTLCGSLLEIFLRRVADRLACIPNGSERLVYFGRWWAAHRIVTEWLARVFAGADPSTGHHIDRNIQLDMKKGVSLTSMSLRMFKTIVFASQKHFLVHSVHEMLVADRAGGVSDRIAIKNAIDMFLVMGVCDREDLHMLRTGGDVESRVIRSAGSITPAFVDDFQVPIAQHTREYYRNIAQQWVAVDDTPSYCARVKALLDQENERCEACLPPASRVVMMNVCREQLIDAHHAFIIQRDGSGMMAMLAACGGPTGPPADVAENLRLMLTLFRGHESAGILPCGPALACASAVFKRFIETRGAEIVAKLQAQRVLPDDAASAGAGTSAGAGKAPKAPKVKINDPEYVRELMRLLDVTTLLLRCFDNDVDFGRVAWRALESVLNSDRDHAEMIATFVDSALRGRIGTDKVDEAQIEAAVTGVLGLLRYLADKDLFREHYCLHMSKRLMLQKSASDDVELASLARLKALCGPQYTKKIEDMVTDFKLGETQRREYEATRTASGALSSVVDQFGVCVLKSSCWPALNAFPSTIPAPAMAACMQHFRAFHEHKFASRTLMWVWGQGTAEVYVKFSASVAKTVLATSLQALVLLAFNERAEYTVRELMDATGMDSATIRNILGSMLFAKDLGILSKLPKSRVIDDAHVVSIDGAFRNPNNRVTLPVPVIEERKAAVEYVAEERLVTIDAALVRIMKTRKTLSHVDLIQEVLKQLTFFRPDMRRTKQRIEHLIKEGYMRREDPESHASPYVYVAGEE